MPTAGLVQYMWCVMFSFLLFPATDLKNGSGSVYPGEPQQGKAGCTLTLSDDDLVDMVTGKLDGQKVYNNLGSLNIGGLLYFPISYLISSQLIPQH